MESIQLKSWIISDKFVKKLCNFQIYYGTMAYSGYMLKNFFQEPVRYGLAEESCKKRGLLFFWSVWRRACFYRQSVSQRISRLWPVAGVKYPVGVHSYYGHAVSFKRISCASKLPFDGTQIDIIVNVSLPEARELPDYMENILKKISAAISGTVIMEDDTFYMLKRWKQSRLFSGGRRTA